MACFAANAATNGFHSVKTSGGLPAATAVKSFCSEDPFCPGTDSVVTWMVGWVRLKSATMFLTTGSQIPDHMFQYVKCTTDWLLLVLWELAALVLPPVNPTSTDTMTTVTLLARIHLFISKYHLPYQS